MRGVIFLHLYLVFVLTLDHLYEGRYSPKGADGKRISKNIYAKTEVECEEKLAELIRKMKAEIAAEKAKIKLQNNA